MRTAVASRVGEVMSDLSSAAEFYANPENREPVGPARRPRHRQLTSHVPVRFDPLTIAAIRMLAWRAGISVSSWIRTAVEREVERQLPVPMTAGWTPGISLQQPPLDAATTNPAYLNRMAERIPS